MWDLVFFLLIGLVAGWLAALATKTRGIRLAGNLGIGIVGAVIGGYLFSLLAYLGQFVVALAGAIVFLAATGRIGRKRKP